MVRMQSTPAASYVARRLYEQIQADAVVRDHVDRNVPDCMQVQMGLEQPPRATASLDTLHRDGHCGGNDGECVHLQQGACVISTRRLKREVAGDDNMAESLHCKARHQHGLVSQEADAKQWAKFSLRVAHKAKCSKNSPSRWMVPRAVACVPEHRRRIRAADEVAAACNACIA
eukprot:CAMPEP_0115850510 /NCGR_PEP_ID=MMETSP0287-20121206/12003_1 /TAXON_ID=412157 /ORGANISM="Chrysochromulina rotalis, Strain UIO044" /LENGTH=172 /DNA_ID=CAMNT_0003304513 /DNA_START=331 /DNA_END=851 /DNA_ORIENTATION=+